MGVGDPFLRDMIKILARWDLCALDEEGASRGIITGRSINFSLINSFVVILGLCTKLHYKNLGLALTLHNVCDPYEDKKVFLSKLFSTRWVKVENLIIGGNLNLILNQDEVWGLAE
jgi:hypothetical protein